MVGAVDPIAQWNIVTTVDAYLNAGFTPAEILQAVHPSKVASTQGTGFGGMQSMRKLYLDRFLNHEIPTDILQEALPNVVAAHVMQSYIGGYGNMIQPVSACATAAVSLEEGFDKIAPGQGRLRGHRRDRRHRRGIRDRLRQHERHRELAGDVRQGHRRALLLARQRSPSWRLPRVPGRRHDPADPRRHRP